ncbi:MAG: hypothetical protein R3C28_33855, partial [Pirellulaceae bacterium]
DSEKVFNIEVHAEHVYFVSESGILTHNVGEDCEILLPGPKYPKSVTRNRLSNAEFAFAKKISDHRGGDLVGQATKDTPGIDGTLDGTPISLKQTRSSSPAAVLTAASKAETSARNAGHKDVEVFIEAENIPVFLLAEFTRNGPLTDIPLQGTISRISVLTADGWYVIPGRG